MKKTFRCLVCLLLCAEGLIAQNPGFQDIEKEKERIDSLSAVLGGRKELPAGFELPALLALSHYPELRSARICFRLKKQKLPYASRPRLGSLLNPFGPKKYVITISTHATALREPTLLQNLSLEAQTGALGHELAHIARYERQGKMRIMADGLRYGNAGFKEKYEKATDEIAIQHGLGPTLLAWCRAVYPIKLRDGHRWRTYYSPEELERLMASKN